MSLSLFNKLINVKHYKKKLLLLSLEFTLKKYSYSEHIIFSPKLSAHTLRTTALLDTSLYTLQVFFL